VILSVAGIQFSYNSHPVLKDVCFELGRGKILGVLGVNGAGKSTLLKCMNRLLRPKRGVVLLSGDNVLGLNRNEVAKRVGYVPQKYNDERLSVYDAVLLGRKPYIQWGPTQKDFDIVESILEAMQLEELALRPLNGLSGGETQKVIIARALAQEPDLLLLDEPTSNLDLKNQLEVMGLVAGAVKQRHISAILSVHDLNLALRFADLFLMLKDGAVFAFSERKSITPDMIREVFGVHVIMSEVQGFPFVIPLPVDGPAPVCCRNNHNK
jgi:iron complex transport system ATP-binding protein